MAPTVSWAPILFWGFSRSSPASPSGHGRTREAGKRESGVDWARLARSVDTLVILMGLKSLPRLARELIAHGRPAATPAALVRWGTTEIQETVVGTLADIAVRAARARLEPPVVVVVGDVVALRDRLQWFDDNHALMEIAQ